MINNIALAGVFWQSFWVGMDPRLAWVAYFMIGWISDMISDGASNDTVPCGCQLSTWL